MTGRSLLRYLNRLNDSELDIPVVVRVNNSREAHPTFQIDAGWAHIPNDYGNGTFSDDPFDIHAESVLVIEA